jgi:hypothetical protein
MILRETPPWTLVIEILGLLNLPSELPYTFQKADICMTYILEVVGLLEPYYIPSKARQFLDIITDETRLVTILRHILLPHGYVVLMKETTRNKKKAILYTVDRASVVEGPLRSAVTMDFS